MSNKQLARKIANFLFTNVQNQHAKRLVLELQDGSDGGGWIESAAADRIEEFLNLRDAEEKKNKE